jgi:dihydroorotate dehydrogenase
MPVIGVGGIMTADDAERMVDAGASLVQVYTGLIFRGPALVRTINRRLAHRPTMTVGMSVP